MSFFDKALSSLEVYGISYTGRISTEEEFLKNAYTLTGDVNDKGEGILSRNPNDFGVTWKQIEDQIKIEEQKYSDTQYLRDRQYPSIGDQLDMQYHDEIDGTTTWKDAIAKVKADIPK